MNITAVVSSAENKSSTYGIYFHGIIEDEVGYDLVCVEKGSLIEGQQRVHVKLSNNLCMPADAYCFYDTRMGQLKGYIVAPSDTSAVETAVSNMNDKPDCI